MEIALNKNNEQVIKMLEGEFHQNASRIIDKIVTAYFAIQAAREEVEGAGDPFEAINDMGAEGLYKWVKSKYRQVFEDARNYRLFVSQEVQHSPEDFPENFGMGWGEEGE